MVKNINSVLKEVLENLKLDEERIKDIEKESLDFIKKLKDKVGKSKLDADVFVGGSLAKGTMINKDKYDIDIFIRFGKKHALQNFSDLTQDLLKTFNEFKIQKIHGSRDYFRINISKDLVFEIIPVKRIKKPIEAENITDFSYSHVRYIKKRIRDSKIPNEIKLAKAFCYANDCYGAESYIKGFSGYALELLIYNYKSFSKFIKSIIKIKNGEKLIIDIEKDHKNKKEILMDLNESKLQSPIILVDPTHKTRNVLAALSEETFRKFQESCRKFIKNPNIEAFEKKKIDFGRIEKESIKKKFEFVLLEAETKKQEGDIAGSKLRKFHEHIGEEIKEYFEIKDKGFEYEGGKFAKFFFVVKGKKEILIRGPFKEQKEHVKRFKKQHGQTFTKGDRVYTRIKLKAHVKKFMKNWKSKNARKIKEMSITELNIN